MVVGVSFSDAYIALFLVASFFFGGELGGGGGSGVQCYIIGGGSGV